MNEKQLKVQLQQLIAEQTAEITADPQTILQATLTAYENARIDGLCHEGAWELALETIEKSLRLCLSASLR